MVEDIVGAIAVVENGITNFPGKYNSYVVGVAKQTVRNRDRKMLHFVKSNSLARSDLLIKN